MTISITPALEARARERAEAEGLSVDSYVERLINEDGEWPELVDDFAEEARPEFEDVRMAVTEGLEQMERGEGRSAREVFAELRAQHGRSR